MKIQNNTIHTYICISEHWNQLKCDALEECAIPATRDKIVELLVVCKSSRQ